MSLYLKWEAHFLQSVLNFVYDFYLDAKGLCFVMSQVLPDTTKNESIIDQVKIKAQW